MSSFHSYRTLMASAIALCAITTRRGGAAVISAFSTQKGVGATIFSPSSLSPHPQCYSSSRLFSTKEEVDPGVATIAKPCCAVAFVILLLSFVNAHVI